MTKVTIDVDDLNRLVRLAMDMQELTFDALKKGPDEMGLSVKEFQDQKDLFDKDDWAVLRARLLCQLSVVHEGVDTYIGEALEHEDGEVLRGTSDEDRLTDYTTWLFHRED